MQVEWCRITTGQVVGMSEILQPHRRSQETPHQGCLQLQFKCPNFETNSLSLEVCISFIEDRISSINKKRENKMETDSNVHSAELNTQNTELKSKIHGLP